MHSWRVLILPFLEQKDLYSNYKFDEPSDGPNNIKLVSQMPQVYRCPAASPDGNTTNYIAVIGDDTIWAPDHTGTDGKARLDVLEVTDPRILWTESRDLTFDEAVQGLNRKDGKEIIGPHRNITHAILDKGFILLVPDGTLGENLRAMMKMARYD